MSHKMGWTGLMLCLLVSCGSTDWQSPAVAITLNEDAVIALADEYLAKEPITITAFTADRSAGGPHDYYSEGLYWWPDPENPNGPYIRKDGERNPGNFRAHKQALNEMAEWVTTLTAAYCLTHDTKYAEQAVRHLVAWFSTPSTRMNPRLLYSQAIKGVSTGRGIGIIDTVCLIDVAVSIRQLQAAGILTGAKADAIQHWFATYGEWLTTHPYGVDERDHGNNHSTWWGAQLADDGSFPDELERTRPFHYTNYNLNAWAIFCQLASTEEENLWAYKSSRGTLEKAVDFVFPFYENPGTWPYPTELEAEIPLHQNDYLYFAGKALGNETCFALWQSLKPMEADHHADLILWQNGNNYE